MLNRIFITIVFASLPMLGYALDSDRFQPATLDADDFELDFKTGVRTYRGNVVYRQGSIKINCDELTTYFNDDGELDKGICKGRPGKFRQRPEGADEDVVGEARTITMDQINELIILQSRADVVQGGNRITGKLITYDMKTEKVRVNSGSQGASQEASSTESTAAGSESSTASEDTQADTSNARPSLIIQPRKKKEE